LRQEIGNQFSGGVPLHHADLSGYGLSLGFGLLNLIHLRNILRQREERNISAASSGL